MSDKKKVFYAILAILIACVGLWLYSSSGTKPGTSIISELKIYKNSGCQCCTLWGDHLEDNGFTVTEYSRNDLRSLKIEKRVPKRIFSCHTAMVNGYIIEGHVPAEDIQRLLEERPEILGIGVGGMPIGSPGMEGPNPEPYTVYTFDEKSDLNVWNRHQHNEK